MPIGTRFLGTSCASGGARGARRSARGRRSGAPARSGRRPTGRGQPRRCSGRSRLLEQSTLGVDVVTAEGLKALYETELRYEVGNLGLASEERQGLWYLFSASRRTPPGELREQDHQGVWLWSDLHLGHAMTISIFGRPYATPEEMDDALFGAWRRVVDPTQLQQPLPGRRGSSHARDRCGTRPQDEKMSSRWSSRPAKSGERSVCPRPKVSVAASTPPRWRWIETVSAIGSTSQYSVTPCLP